MKNEKQINKPNDGSNQDANSFPVVSLASLLVVLIGWVS